MAKQRNAFRAGIFMVISVALVIFVIVAISGADRFTQTFKTYGVEFSLRDDVGGLRVGDDVRIGGLRVGSVRDIQIIQQKRGEGATAAQGRLIVYIEVPSKYLLGKDASVAIQKGLTGSAAINIDDPGDSGEIASAGDVLVGKPDSLSALMRKLGDIQPDLQQIVGNVKIASGKLNTDLDKFADTADAFTLTGIAASSTVQDLHVRLPDIIWRYDEIATAAVSMLDAVREFLGPSSGDFHSTVANLNRLSSDLSKKLPDLITQVHGILTNLDIATGKADRAMEEIEATANNTRELTASAKAIISGNKSKLDGIIASLKTTSDNLKNASAEIRHAPWRLLYQPKPEEVSNLAIYDSVRQFAEGAGSLDDAASALRDALNDKNADPAQVKRLMDKLEDSFNKFQDVQQKMFKEIKE